MMRNVVNSWLAMVLLSVWGGRSSAFEEAAFDQAAETAALKSIGSFASNIQKNRDGSVRFVRFSKAVVADKHVREVGAFSRIDYLAVVSPDVTDAGLEPIAKLTNLDTLWLSNTQATDATLRRAAKLPRLSRLYVNNAAITDAGVQALAAHEALTIVDLNDTALTDASTEALATLSQLETLSLANTRLTSQGVARLAALPALRYLVLRGLKLNDLSALAKFPRLEVVDLTGVKLTPELLGPLLESKSLKRVIARETTLERGDLAEVLASEPKFELVLSPEPLRAQDPLQRYLAGERLRTALGKVQSSAAATPATSTRVAPAKERFNSAEVGEVPDFQRHVIPLLGRLGCNGRTCHGSFQGQGGFRLSMFGYDFAADWTAIHGEEHQRIEIENPDDSLLIQKPTEAEPHEGGLRFEPGGWEHALLRRWIAAGGKNRPEKAAKLVRFYVEPSEIVFAEHSQEVPLRCLAEWSDGVTEDVTCLTRFQTNSDVVATVDSAGLVKSVGPGDTHVIAFYDKGVFAIPVMRPFASPLAISSDKAAKPIDRFINRKLSKLGLAASPLCTDSEFLRRVRLDLTGTLPTPDEITAFQADKTADKRARKVDELLAAPAYVEWWTMRLADLTGSNAQSLGSTDMNSPAAVQWVDWLRRRVKDNVGWDRIAAGMILATSRRRSQDYGEYAAEQSRHLARRQPTDFSALENPMHYYWFRSNNQTPSDRALSFSFVFLGVRLECAQCHKHPFDRWSQEDFAQFTQFFSRIKAGVSPESRDAQTHLKVKLGVPEKLDTAALRRQMYLRVAAEGLSIPWNEIWIQPGKTNQTARLLGGESFDLSEFEDPREPLFEWLAGRDNPYFAKAFVNRIWFRYFGRGIVDPPDDFNQANPPSHPRLLQWLADGFVDNKYDMKWLHREIILSDAYQRSSLSTKNSLDEKNYSHALIRRLPAEVAIDAILQATAKNELLTSWATNMKSRKIAQHPRSFQARGVDYSLLVFGKPLRTTNCDCERQQQPTLLQSIYRRNDKDILESLERADGWLREVASRWKQDLLSELKPKTASTQRRQGEVMHVEESELLNAIEQAYLRTLSRRPNSSERRRALAHFAQDELEIESLRDLLWALINTREFVTNH